MGVYALGSSVCIYLKARGARSSLPSVFINKISLEHSHTKAVFMQLWQNLVDMTEILGPTNPKLFSLALYRTSLLTPDVHLGFGERSGDTPGFRSGLY